MTYIMGIDPGLKGAIAIIDPLVKPMAIVALYDTPVIETPGKKTVIDTHALVDIMERHATTTRLCVIEDVGVMTGMEGRVSMFNFGKSTGILEGVVGSFKIPLHRMKPAIWKAILGLGRDKTSSRNKAVQLFPGQERFFVRKKDDGRAEAVLLATLGARL